MQTISLGKAIYMLLHLSVKVLQSFSFAYFGYAISETSEKCLQAIYESYWPESCNKQFMQDISIIMIQKPMVFNAMGFMNLGFEMFTKASII